MGQASSTTTTVAVVADTHGVVRGAVAKSLEGVSHILHAGDIGRQEVLEELGRYAPITAVRGNVDTGEWAANIPASTVVRLAGYRILLIHDVERLESPLASYDCQIVISGHSHRYSVRVENGIVLLNPGGCGPRRFGLPVTMARLHLGVSWFEPEIVFLEEYPARNRTGLSS